MQEQSLLQNANSKIYHFELHNGKVVSVEAKEAWALYDHPPKVLGPIKNRPKLIGTSDGRIFEKARWEAVDMIKNNKREEARVLLKTAMEQEIEEGKKHPEIPPNHDRFDLQGRPTN